jgi:hypothetical protein
MPPLIEDDALIGDTHTATIPCALPAGAGGGAGVQAGHLDGVASTGGRWFALGTAAGCVAGIRLTQARRF